MASDLAINVGRQIRARRLAAGLHRQRELADKMRSPTVSNQTVSDWERGVNKPSDENLEELAEILGCEVADFYAAPETPETPDTIRALDGDGAQLDRIEQIVTEIRDQLNTLIQPGLAQQITQILARATGQQPPKAPRPSRAASRAPSPEAPRRRAAQGGRRTTEPPER